MTAETARIPHEARGPAPLLVLPALDERRTANGERLARLPEAVRVALAQARLERAAARQGRRDARRGRIPDKALEYGWVAPHYARAFLAELRALGRLEALRAALRCRPWLRPFDAAP